MLTLIKCPKCKNPDTKVVYAKTYPFGNTAKRRRICLKCEYEFKTKEKLDEQLE